MGLETVMLKGARVQKLLTALFYLVLAVCSELYVVCESAKFFRDSLHPCTLRFRRSQSQAATARCFACVGPVWRF